MKFQLLIILAMPACQTARQVTLPNGATYADNGHFAGDTLVMIEPDGTVILRNKMNKPFQDFLQAVGSMYGINRTAAVSMADIASDEAKRAASLKATTANNAINAEVEKLKITTDAGTEALRIVTPR